jgi:hypothetical protein
MAQTPQQGSGFLGALQDDLDDIRGHLARQGKQFISVLPQGFCDQGDFLFTWRREWPPLHLGEEIRRDINAAGQLPEGVAFLYAKLSDESTEGLIHV